MNNYMNKYDSKCPGATTGGLPSVVPFDTDNEVLFLFHRHRIESDIMETRDR